MATVLETKRKKFVDEMEKYRVQPASYPERANAICAAVDYVHTAIELYVESAAKDREEAAKDREAARQEREADRQRQQDDRDQQKADRKTMNRLTFVIAFATIGTVAGPFIQAKLKSDAPGVRNSDTSQAAETSPSERLRPEHPRDARSEGPASRPPSFRP